MLRGEEKLSVRNATRAATAWVASPVGRLACIEALVTISCCLLAVLVLLGSGLRASSRVTFRLAVWSALMLSYPAVSYTIGLMQSASFRNELIVAWGCFLLLLLGCADGIAAYSLNDSDQQARTVLNQGLQVVYVLVLLISYVGAQPLHLKVLLFLLWALSAAKLVMRVRSSILAGRDSVLTVENKLIADYMSNKEHMEGGRNYDATTMKGYKYVVAGEADRPIDPSDDDIVTVEKVWQCQGILLSSDVDAAARRRKDICLSFAMFKLLRRRLGGFPLTEARLNKTRDFVKVGLLAGKEHERMYRVIEVELGFLFDFYYARYRSPKETLIPDALLFAAVVAASLGTLFSPAVLDYRPSSKAVAAGYDIWLTRTVIALFLVLESFQFLMLVFSDWHKVKMLCRYVRDKSWHNRPVLQRMLRLMCQRKGVWRLPLPGWIMGFLIRSRMTRHRKLPEEVKRSIYVFLKNGLTRVRYGEYTLEKNGVRGVLRLSARPTQLPATSAAERILVWHIATQVCDLMSQSQLANEPSGSHVRKEHLVAATLSAYCAYLVSSAPELLQEHSYDTRLLLEGVQSEARGALKGCRSRDHICSKLDEVPAEPPSVHRYILAEGKRLGEILHGRVSKWELLAELWVELLLSVAPSDNVNGHVQKLADGGELITHLWALLTHAGVVEKRTIITESNV
ncbi:uncharacterized protein C2845_PM07G03540 [Panicum miliaceum]|uniref:DUF4220 domain-containing protein n=1 Tax=Panicum miliaceum TaxID=4540 RepID=A0A3L6SL79_PANMI|nr:uncharacterized protein C2845_PM07G03540 [Panicum miliaceum]